MADLFVISLILLAFLPLSATLIRSPLAYLFAPVISAAVALLAGILHVLIDIPILAIWSLALVAQAPLAISKGSRQAMIAALTVSRKDFVTFGQLATATVLSAVAVITTPAPLAWDARSIWFLHAAWLNGPALFFREAQFLPAGSWPDYPVLGPSLMALAYQATGGDANLWLASRIIGVLVLIVGVWAIATFIQRFAPKLHFSYATAIVALFTLSCTLLADGYYNAGYMDALQAVTVVALFSSVLSLPDGPKILNLVPSALLFLVAANIKQEGFWFAIGALLLGLTIQLARKQFVPLLLLPFAALVRVGWSAFQEHLGMPDNGHTAEVIERLPRLLQGDEELIGNIDLIWSTWGQPRSFGYVVIALAAAFVVPLLLPRGSDWIRRFLVPTVLLAAPIGVLSVAIVTYALGQSGGLEWWLGTSYTRITASFEALSLFAAAAAAILLLPESKPKVIVQAKTSKKRAKRSMR
jgi:hypothetical protein